MDDKTAQSWSAILSEIRGKRLASAAGFTREKDGLKEFSALSRNSLDVVLSKWWEMESPSFPSSASPDEIQARIEEMSSVVDFELEAIETDMLTFEASIAWNDATAKDVSQHLSIAAEQLKQNYAHKIQFILGASEAPAMAGAIPPPPADPFSPIPAAPLPSAVSSPSGFRKTSRSSGGSSSGSGVALFLMFILGLLLGSGPSFYFWDSAQKAHSTDQDKVERLTSEKRALEDNLGVYQENISKMAHGRMLTFPQLDEKMRPIREDIESRRRKANSDFNSKRESLMRKTPAGDRLDRAVDVLKEKRDATLSDLDIEEKNRLEPYLKQMQLLRELAEK